LHHAVPGSADHRANQRALCHLVIQINIVGGAVGQVASLP